MTREQQRKLKTLKQVLPGILKEEMKPYKFKKKDFMVWCVQGDLFFNMHIFIAEKDGHCYCDCHEGFKPLWADDLLWDILGMPENKKEPLSLRSIGAFTVYGVTCFDERRELSSWEPEELEKCVRDYMAHFDQTVHAMKEKDYGTLLNPSEYHGDLQELLLLIHEGKYREASEYAKAMEDEWFENEGIGFRQRAKRYIVNSCKKL
ncbi:MAG: hypothetical protein K2O32_02380 [Acetatifactor sp.]|nr:hypothetical protein [Acetatifactor sp.]